MTRPPINIVTIGHQYDRKHALVDTIARLWQKKKATVKQSTRRLRDAEAKAESEIFEFKELHYASPHRSYVQIDCVGRADRVVERALAAFAPVAGAVLVVSANTSEDNDTVNRSRGQMIAATEAGLRHLVVFIDECAAIDDVDLIELVEQDVREKVRQYRFDEDATPIIRGDLAGAASGDASWEASIEKLIAALDRHIPG